ncbi:hypothetical protein PRUB_a0086 [Pseudoalteromonas rubra]|uniref:Gp5/Type VI secretion system Vgr protein OB-fold domain-containing protein n=1 Tax=Pseudoalteromonas rubra TaxID=43658 RepID=A0A8T0C523_9GAMM|nr:contractile injection system protein, VgrG/Pvc8 family [Pseudoalteromonas rubra]KAF7785720.1 hypothetical protein PRUB_a0086 [Pseudoalteromonas rubra]
MRNTVTITINKNKEKVLSEQLVSLKVNQQFNCIPSAEMTLVTGNFSDRVYPLFQDPQFELGKPIDIYARYEESGARDTLLFSGIIMERYAEVKSKLPVMRIVMQDPASRLRTSIASRLFSDKTDADIIKQVLAEHEGLKLAGQAAGKLDTIRHDQWVQMQQSDWDFILQQVLANGLLVKPANGEIQIVDLNEPSSQKLKIDLGVERSVLDFSLCHSGRDLYSSVSIEYWDQAENTFDQVEKTFGDDATKHLKNAKGQFFLPQLTTKKQALSALSYFELQQVLNKNSGSVTIAGNSDVELGQTLELSRFPDIVSDSFTITGVQHTLRAGQWTTQLQIGQTSLPLLNQYNFPFKNVRTGIESAEVLEWQADPLKLGRIPVNVHSFGEGIYWAYCGQLSASEEQGGFFIPKKGEQVYIGFINSNPSLGVILTSVYSSEKSLPKPFKFDPKSPSGVFWGDVNMVFEPENKVLKLTTGDKNELLLSIDKGMTLTTKNSLTIECASKAELKSDSSVTIKGQVINLN